MRSRQPPFPACMNITKTLYVTNRKDWRNWLIKHYQTEKEIWLVYYKKESGKERILYNDAVEEALCFGWIDSTIKGIDDQRFAQRFSPRNPKSRISQANKERLNKLIDQGKVRKDVLATLGDISSINFKISPDILKAIKADKEAWKNFQKFSPAYKRIRVGFIEGARNRPEEFQKRLSYFIKMTR
jgi:uncharacterized protein YdeI (YjbR/CyaY-like superfamily)